ncbi:MAG: KH domain-containing protein [Actinomycetota bacterium]|nr:KH domain-containing protein [Actinomycetota bacterium]MDA3013173.1 KH domain-containing protein [Actinomycetota bacterium]
MSSESIVKNVVEYIVSQIVEDKKSVNVTVAASDDEKVTIEVRTSSDDMGRVIGKRGRVARAIRTVAQAAADEEGLQSTVEFID